MKDGPRTSAVRASSGIESLQLLGDDAASTAVVSPEQPPLPLRRAAAALLRCVVTTCALLARRRIEQPTRNVGRVLRFADESSARVYRETVVYRQSTLQPAVLMVEFRLRWVHGWGHAAFRLESILNTPLFVGFPGFVSKLWLAHDENEVYRGVYEWDGPQLAHAYARALWWVLALVSIPDSIHYVVLPEVRRDEMLGDLRSRGHSG
jgi:hypothetical protein